MTPIRPQVKEPTAPLPPEWAPLAADARAHPAPAGWSWHLLTDLGRLESGHTPSRYHPEWWGGEIPWLALPDIRRLDGQTAIETTEYTNPEGIAHSSARILPTGTVCLSRTASVGFVTVLGKPMATSQDFVNWVCGPQLHPWFLAYLFLAARHYFRSLSSGATHKTVYVPTVKAFRVCVPPIAEQKRIATLVAGQLSELAKALKPARAQAEAAHMLAKASLTAAFRGEAAARWPMKRLSEAADVVNGYGFAEHLQGRTDLRYPFVKVSDMNSEGAETIVSTAANTVDDAILRALRARTYPAGTVIFPKVGGALLTNKKRILGVEASFDNNVMGLVPRGAESRWLFYWLQTIDLVSLSNTQALPSIRQSAVAALQLPVPPVDVQRGVIADLDSRLRAAAVVETAVTNQLASLIELPAVLLRAVFSGAA